MSPSDTDAKPVVFFDNDVLLTLVCDETAQDAVMLLLGDRCRVTSAVKEETTGSLKDTKLTATGLAGHARRLALQMTEVEVTKLSDAAVDRMARIKDQLSDPDDGPRKHLGEAASIAAAVELGGIVATHDTDAKVLAAHEGVQAVGVRQLLTKARTSGLLTDEQADDALEAMRRKGRTPPD